jgi:hypothetical protein
MAKATVNGVEYELRFDLDAMEQVEDTFGSLKEMFTLLREGRQQVRTVRTMFVILANSASDYVGDGRKVDEKALKHLPLEKLKELGDAIRAALEEGMHAETVDGNEADDNVHDGYLAEIEAEEKKA